MKGQVDTSEKIVDLDGLPALLEKGEWRAVAGLFDPLTLTQAQRVAAAAEAGQKVLVIVIPDRDTLLTAEARAALVAGLRSIDAVIIGDPEKVGIPGVRIPWDEAAERERSAEFIRFVLRRQKSAEIPA